MRLEIAAGLLFTLNRFKQRLEVALSEAPASLALNNFEEQRRAIFNRARENLEHVTLIITIDEDSKLFELFDRFIDRPHATLQFRVVGVRHMQEFDALFVQFGNCVQDVIRRKGDMLNARPRIEVQVLLDLRFLLAFGRFIDRELHVPVSIRHHL